jgi:hypothetical protein
MNSPIAADSLPKIETECFVCNGRICSSRRIAGHLPGGNSVTGDLTGPGS